MTAESGDTSAQVSWSAPATDGGSPITGYVVTPYVGAVAQTPVAVGLVTTTSFGGLTNGTTYTFTVSAVNAVGTGPAATSNWVVAGASRAPPPRTPPRAGAEAAGSDGRADRRRDAAAASRRTTERRAPSPRLAPWMRRRSSRRSGRGTTATPRCSRSGRTRAGGGSSSRGSTPGPATACSTSPPGRAAVALELVRQKGCTVVGVDQSEGMLETARQRVNGRVELVQASAE